MLDLFDKGSLAMSMPSELPFSSSLSSGVAGIIGMCGDSFSVF